MVSEKLLRLRQIGLTEGEIKVYEALLRIGQSTKTRLSKEANVAPANIYDITERLAEKGIISIVEQNGVKHFSPTNPNKLLDFLEKKKEEVSKEEKLVQQLLPSLQEQFKEKGANTRIEIFTGWEGLKTVFKEMIDECDKGDYNYVYGASEGELPKQADRFFSKYSKLRESKGIIVNIIFNENLRQRKERIDFFVKSKLCNVKFLNQKTLVENIVYKDTALLLILTEDPMAIRIREPKVASGFKQYFDVMWALAKS